MSKLVNVSDLTGQPLVYAMCKALELNTVYINKRMQECPKYLNAWVNVVHISNKAIDMCLLAGMTVNYETGMASVNKTNISHICKHNSNIAIARCFVEWKLGVMVEIPESILEDHKLEKENE